jgi:hypothetical protein
MWESQQAFPNLCGNPRPLWISIEVSFSTGLSVHGSRICGDRSALLAPFLALAVLQTFCESDTFPIEFVDRAVMGQPVKDAFS